MIMPNKNLEKAEIAMMGFLRMTMNCKLFSHTCKFVRDNFENNLYVYVADENDGGRTLTFGDERIGLALTYAEFKSVVESLPVQIDSIRVGDDYIFNHWKK
jgi:hypothetical protein|tara:strand:- start:1097 stop:1399 length:303 start_codon:yes stop_codon:yes gene_type:complete